jgi:glycosyltransferase involved in cell wall biosynthesis
VSNSHPLVSILIPAFNAENWIRDAIESALSQTWPRIEIIVIDDGSKDDTYRIASSFSGPKVTVLTQENCGASASRNRALSISQGDYIQWLDADDILDHDKISNQLRDHKALSPKTLLSSAWARYYYRPKRAHFRWNELCRDHNPASWMQTKMETNAWMAIESWLIPRTISDSAGPWDTALTADDDGEYFARIVCSSERIIFDSSARSRCRLANPNSLSRGGHSPKWLESQLSSVSKQVGYLMAIDSGIRSRKAACTYLQRWYAHLYPDHPSLMRRAENLAVELGGSLERPTLRGKYRVLEPITGRRLAKRIQFLAPRIRSRAECWWDRLMHSLSN